MTSNDARPRRALRRGVGLAATAMAFTALLAACTQAGGGTTPTGSSGGETVITIPDNSSLPAEKVSEILQKAFLTPDIKPDDLDPTILNGLLDAGADYTDEQIKTAERCLTETECKIGDGKLVFAILDGSGGNLWRVLTRAATTLQATLYPEIGTVIYQDAGGELATMQAQLQSLQARGVDLIATYDDFGPAMIGSFQSATAAGIPIVAYGGVPGPDGKNAVVSQVASDFCDDGDRMAEAAKDSLGGSGSVAFFTGTPGNPQGEGWMTCAEKWFSENAPDIKVVNRSNTDWSQQGTFSAASALISSGTDVDAILYDYATQTVNIVDAYQKAGEKVPTQITWTTDNTLTGMWEKDQGTDKAWDLYYTTSINFEGNIALRALAEKLNGGDVSPELIFPLPFVKAKVGDFDPNQPPNGPGLMVMPDALVEAILSSQ